MAVANLHAKIDIFARQIARDPIRPIDFEFVADQIFSVADDHAISLRIDIDDVTRPKRSARQSFALTDREQFNAFVFADEVSSDIVNLAAMKFVFAEMGTQESLVIVAWNETNFLAVDLIRDFQA